MQNDIISPKIISNNKQSLLDKNNVPKNTINVENNTISEEYYNYKIKMKFVDNKIILCPPNNNKNLTNEDIANKNHLITKKYIDEDKDSSSYDQYDEDEDYIPYNNSNKKNYKNNKSNNKKIKKSITNKYENKLNKLNEYLVINNKCKILYETVSDILNFIKLNKNITKKSLIESLLKNIDINDNFIENIDDNNNLLKNDIDINNFFENKSFLNVDIRYFSLEYLTKNLGYFDVIMMDPPWRIKGAQKIDSSFMFSNSNFKLDYNTMSNQEIKDIEVEKLSEKGFIFLWILANQIKESVEILNKWGYELVDIIVWVKLKNNSIFKSQGYYFMHSYEQCWVGYKCPYNNKVSYNSKVTNNIIFSEVKKKSQKPEKIYEIINSMMPNAKKLEIFARNHNLKEDWFAIGNQLGIQYEKFDQLINCNFCKKIIEKGKRRYKFKKGNNFDLCEICINNNKNYNLDEFFKLENKAKDTLHENIKCDNCNQNPIWGNRFSCKICKDSDLCELCYDLNIPEHSSHEFTIFEVPELASGFSIHLNHKCYSCYSKPIIGNLFFCKECPNLNYCQQCFYKDSLECFRNHPLHKSDHKFIIRSVPIKENLSNKKCFICKKKANYKCEQCFEFFFCNICYIDRNNIKIDKATSHTKDHYNYININN